MRKNSALYSIIIYYTMAAVFSVCSYGLLLLIYGEIRLSFLEWALIMLVAFTFGYLPTFI